MIQKPSYLRNTICCKLDQFKKQKYGSISGVTTLFLTSFKSIGKKIELVEMAHRNFPQYFELQKELCCRTLIPWGETHKSNNMIKPFKVKMPPLAV